VAEAVLLLLAAERLRLSEGVAELVLHSSERRLASRGEKQLLLLLLLLGGRVVAEGVEELSGGTPGALSEEVLLSERAGARAGMLLLPLLRSGKTLLRLAEVGNVVVVLLLEGALAVAGTGKPLSEERLLQKRPAILPKDLQA